MEWMVYITLGLSLLTNAGQFFVGFRNSRSQSKSVDADTLEKVWHTAHSALERVDATQTEIKKMKVESEDREGRLADLEARAETGERDYLSFMDSVNVACWEVDGQGRSHKANFTFLELTGLEINEFLDIDWLTTVCIEDLALVRRVWRKMIDAGDTTLQLRFRFCNRKTGALTDVEAHIKSYPLPHGRVYKYSARTKPIK